MTGPLALAAALAGAALGAGLCLVVFCAPPLRRFSLVERIGPFVPGGPVPGSRPPWAERTAALVERWFGVSVSVRRRLQRSGDRRGLAAYRARQARWAALGLGAGAAAAAGLGAAQGFRPGAALALLIVGAGGGLVACDAALSAAVARRERRLEAEFPVVAEMLALALAAGEAPTPALRRVAAATAGELARELRRALVDAGTGSTLVAALDALARRVEVPAISRFVDGVAIALDRGTPLAQVLRAQAAEAREASRRGLIERGGRREVAMLAPVVLLILPVTVAFAVYPSLALLGAL